MICVETIGKIRRWHRVDELSISKIAKRLSASCNTIAKYLDEYGLTDLAIDGRAVLAQAIEFA